MIVLLKSVFVRKYCSYKQGVFFVILMFVPQTWKPYHYRQWAANVYSWPLSIRVLQRATPTGKRDLLKFVWSSPSTRDTLLPSV